MFRRLFFLLLLPLCSFTELWEPDHFIKAEADRMITDNFGNVYLIKGESISKYDSKGVLQKTFSNKTYGAITSADATNPLRIVLYYQNFSRVLFLDNTLSPIGDELQLESLGFSLATAVCSSHDNGLWIFNQQNFELIRLNRSMQVESRTGNLVESVGMTVSPTQMIEKDDRLYLLNPGAGIMIFDVFGNYFKTIPDDGEKSFQVSDNCIVYFKRDRMKFTNIINGESSEYIQPMDDSAIDMRIEKSAVFVLKKDVVDIYSR